MIMLSMPLALVRHRFAALSTHLSAAPSSGQALKELLRKYDSNADGYLDAVSVLCAMHAMPCPSSWPLGPGVRLARLLAG
jgi:hypothetical protein